MPIRVTFDQFEQMVWDAVDELPPQILPRIANLEIEVKPAPTEDDLAEADVESAGDLFGFYQGIPLTERDTGYDMTLPDLISIYQHAHEQACNTLDELRDEVRRTVRHEIAHHFGIGDERLDELDAVLNFTARTRRLWCR